MRKEQIVRFWVALGIGAVVLSFVGLTLSTRRPRAIEQFNALRDIDIVINQLYEFKSWQETRPVQMLERGSAAVLDADFEGPSDEDTARFRVFPSTGSARVAFEAMKVSPNVDRAPVPGLHYQDEFCTHSEFRGYECFHRAENAILSGRSRNDRREKTPYFGRPDDAQMLLMGSTKNWLSEADAGSLSARIVPWLLIAFVGLLLLATRGFSEETIRQ
jgi:hypothetical protein